METRPAIDPTTGLPHAVRTYWSIQCLRGIAALLVVIGHAQTVVAAAKLPHGFARSTLLPWGAGVDLFFVISGFVMVHASRPLFATPGARQKFVRRRLIRIVPLYWLATTAMLMLLATASWKGGDPFPTPRGVIASFLFLPFDTWGDGALFPVIDLGWTLNYELFFYALFALFVPWPRRFAAIGLGMMLMALTVVGSMFHMTGALQFWTRPILIDFGLGVLIGFAASEGITLSVTSRWLIGLAALLVFAIDPSGLFAGPGGVTVANEWPRVLWAGLPCALMIAALTLGQEPIRPATAKPLQALGDASYSLYLLHPFALILLEKLMQKLPEAAAWPGAALVPVTVAAAIALALASHRLVEQPLTAWLTLRLRPAKPRLAAVAVEQSA